MSTDASTDQASQASQAGPISRPWLHHKSDDAYDAAAPWNTAVPSQPRAVATVEAVADVVAAVRYAADQGLRVAVRCTGHGAVPVDAGVLLVHTASMTECIVHPSERWARVGAGVRWRQVVDAAAAHGLAPVCGAAPDVGVVGHLTGGGIGPTARTFGVSSDYVRAMDVVTGAGEILRVTPAQHEDLFWGLRGGRSNLGIVTAVDIDLVEFSDFYGGCLWFDAADARTVLQEWRRWTHTLPEEATTSAAMIKLPSTGFVPPALAGRQVVAIRYAWVNEYHAAEQRAGEQQAGEQCLEPIRRAAAPLLDDIRHRPSAEIGAVHNDPRTPRAVRHCSALLNELPAEAVERLLDTLSDDQEPGTFVELRLLGGAIATPRQHPSALCHRDAAYLLFVSELVGPGFGTAQHGRRLLADLAPWSRSGLFPNFLASDDAEQLRRCYDKDTTFWLQSLANQYDPDRVLLR